MRLTAVEKTLICDLRNVREECRSMPKKIQLKFYDQIMLFPSEVKVRLQSLHDNLQRRHEAERFRKDAQIERVLNLEI